MIPTGQTPKFVCQEHPADEVTASAEPVAMLGRDQRKSSRQPVKGPQQPCELKVGSHVLPALLVNESHGGFAVMVESADGLKTGRKVQLRTTAGWVSVRIVYLNKVASPKSTDRQCDSWFRLGLRKSGFSFFF
jgi:hypothetical protein